MKERVVSHSKGVFYAWKRPQFKDPLLVWPLLQPVPVWEMHRHEKRLVPCVDGVCLRCKFGIPGEDRCIFPAFDYASRLTVIVDLPACHSVSINGILETFHNRPDIGIRICRLRPSNGPITVSPSLAPALRDDKLWDKANAIDTITRLLQSNTAFSDEILRAVGKTGHDVDV